MKNTNDTGSVSAETTKETNKRFIDKDTRSQALKKAFDESIDYNWSYYKAPDENKYSIVVLDPNGWNPILAKTDKFLVEHICKTHNDWLAFKQKSGEKKIKKGNLRRLKNLAWRMKTFREAFKLIEKNNYLEFDSIKTWIGQHEDDVNQWIFTKWLKNSSNCEDWMWYFNNQGNFIHDIAPNEYSEISYNCLFTGYFMLGYSRSINGVPDGKWDPYTLHDEYEGKLFPGGKDWATALVLEKMFDFADDYVKHNGWITGEMADKYHIDLKLVEANSNSDVLLDKMDPDTAKRIQKMVEEKKTVKVDLQLLDNLSFVMGQCLEAFQLIQNNNYLGFDSIKDWLKENEDNVNLWIFTNWLQNWPDYKDWWTWFFYNRKDFMDQLSPDKYSEVCKKCLNINYFQFGKNKTVATCPHGEWEAVDFHKLFEKTLFGDGKNSDIEPILKQMFNFAKDYDIHNGWVTAEMANKYGINDIDAANAIRTTDQDKNKMTSSQTPIEKRVDDLEKMVRDIWENICADKQPAPYTEAPSHGSSSSADEWNKTDGVEAWNDEDHPFPKEIINKKPVLEGQKCPHCRKSKEGCEFYDKGTCRGICYPTYPPQFDPCVFEK